MEAALRLKAIVRFVARSSAPRAAGATEEEAFDQDCSFPAITTEHFTQDSTIEKYISSRVRSVERGK